MTARAPIFLLLFSHLGILALGFRLGAIAVGDPGDPTRTARLSTRTSLLTATATARTLPSRLGPAAGRPGSPAGSASDPKSYTAQLAAFMERTRRMNARDLLTELHSWRHGPRTPSRLLAEQMLLARYAELDPETALSYADGLSGEAHRMGALTVMTAWAASDPEAASAHFQNHHAAFGLLDPQERQLAGHIAAAWAERAPDEALRWAESLSPDVQGEAYRQIAVRVVDQDPARAVELATSAPDTASRREMLLAAAQRWGDRDPMKAATWILSLAPSDQKTTLPSLIASWMRTDPMAASSWLAQRPATGAKDQAVLALLEARAVRHDSEAATAWATIISDPGLRSAALLKISR